MFLGYLLPLGFSLVSTIIVEAASVANVTIGNNTYTYDALVGHGFWSASAQDMFG